MASLSHADAACSIIERSTYSEILGALACMHQCMCVAASRSSSMNLGMFVCDLHLMFICTIKAPRPVRNWRKEKLSVNNWTVGPNRLWHSKRNTYLD